MTPLRVARLQSAQDGWLEVEFDGGWRARIGIVAEGLGRVQFTPPDGLREPRTWAIAPEAFSIEGRPRDSLFPSSMAAVATTNAGATIATASLRATIRLEPFGIEWEQQLEGQWQRCCTDRPSYAYGSSARAGTLTHWQARDAYDQYFGLGDKTGPLNKAGRRLRTRQLDALGYNGETSDPLYKHWPFFLGRRADTGSSYGIYYDTLAECTFDFGQEYDNYHDFYRATEIADGDLDYYVFAGPDIPAALARFVALIGGTAMPPRWSLGYANTAMALADFPDAQHKIREFLALAERDCFPLSSFHFGSGYTSRGKQRYVFTWNTSKFPDARGLLADFKAAGVRTMANLKPCLLNDHPAYAGIEASGGFVRDAATGKPCLDQFWDGWGAHLDFTRAEDRAWWQNGVKQQVLGYGINTAWNDNNEYEIWSEGGQSNGSGQPIPIHRSRSLHALLMTQATAEAQSDTHPDERVYTVTRAGPPGIQRFAQTWSGDNTTSWHTMRWNQRMALTMSLSGMFNVGHDIGGFAGPVPDAEMLIRWTQACCLVPRMIMNSWKADGSVNSPWLHAEATRAIRAAIGLRLKLMPYLYTLMWRAATAHQPVLRPTFFDFGDDANTWLTTDEVCDSMMIGGDLLTAPVFEPGARHRTVYLPGGKHAEGWFDYWTQQYYAGGQTVTVDAPLERVPLFARAGALIPTTDAADDLARTEEPSRAIAWWPRPVDASGAATSHSAALIFEDDGLQTQHTPDCCVVQQFHGEADRDDLSLTLSQRGEWSLPYASIRVVLPAKERRPLTLQSSGVSLAR
ncbi:MAG: glycoside hydrolase family 31 protein [Burkholderiales bacterium]|nr:glycoside hydrolase family 31 protein [Burkholderiales bacterium]